MVIGYFVCLTGEPISSHINQCEVPGRKRRIISRKIIRHEQAADGEAKHSVVRHTSWTQGDQRNVRQSRWVLISR
jgi:hypothetical protein